MPTASTLKIALQNRTASNRVYAYVTGGAIDHNNALFLLRNDGRTAYYPTSPVLIGSPLTQDCSIHLGPPNSTITVTVPHLASARIWFSVDDQLIFKLNPGPALIEPSVTNPSDPNININWGFAEFTYDAHQLFANITYVDFVSLPISLSLASNDSHRPIQNVTGIPANGLDMICYWLRAQDAIDRAGWSSLIVQRNGVNLRALSPDKGIVMNSSLFLNYYKPYVDQVWEKYSHMPLSVDTQSGFGTIAGRVINDVLVLGHEAFPKPFTKDIFSCSTGPFEERGSPERAALIPRLTAALNRSTLLVDDTIPDTPRDAYFRNAITNHYARIVHGMNLDQRGYAFPYDDVGPSGGQDESGSVSDGDPHLLTVSVGGARSFSVNPPLRAQL